MRTDRLNQMEAFVLRKGTATLYDLAGHFDISLNTVRRDVAALIERGHIRKVYGGVSALGDPEGQSLAALLPLAKRAGMHGEQKRVIGELAASLVEEDSVIFLDSGTTVPHMLPHLAGKNATVVTHSLSVLAEAVKYPALEVLAVGGALNHATYSLVDGSLSALPTVRPQALFMAATALSADWGASNNTYEEYRMKSEIVNRHGNVIVLADGSKFGKKATYCYCPFDRIRTVVTDRLPDARFMDAARESGIRVLWPGNRQ